VAAAAAAARLLRQMPARPRQALLTRQQQLPRVDADAVDAAAAEAAVVVGAAAVDCSPANTPCVSP